MSRRKAGPMSSDQQNGRQRNTQRRSALASDEIRAKLQHFTERLESHSKSTPVTARNVEQRLAALRAEITAVVRKEASPFCNCNQITVAFGHEPEKFEAETKLVCPIHGRRSLGVIVPLMGLPYDDSDLRLIELMDRYARSSLEFGGQI